MSAPFSFRSPYIPPHSTPTDDYVLNRPRAQHPPVINPYDKFTQNDFDQWIGNITGALRRALGHESDGPDPRTEKPESPSAVCKDPTARRVCQDVSDSEDTDEYGSEGDGVNDSLADIRLRHVVRLDKGKGRDPMEGPGLSTFGKGDRDAPIEIDLDEGLVLPQPDPSTDEDALDGEEVAQHLSFVWASDEEEEDSDNDNDRDDDGEVPDQWKLPQSPLRTIANSGEVEDEDKAERVKEGSDDAIEALSPDESSDEEQVVSQKVATGDEHEILKSEEDEDRGGDEEVDAGVSPQVARYDDEEDLEGQSADEEQLEEDSNSSEEGDEEQEGSDEDEADSDEAEEEEYGQLERNHCHSPQREVIILDSDEEDQLDEETDMVQPPDQNTTFPPLPGDTQTHVEIRDPWLGPQTYAEDYYSGGPVLSLPYTIPSAHILGINDDGGDFLTSGVVTPAESNERETSVNGELDGQVSRIPHLQFVHGIVASSEMPPETDFAGTEDGPKTIQVYDIDVESDGEKAGHVQGEPRSSPLRFETDEQNCCAELTDVKKVEDTKGIEQQARPCSMPSPVAKDKDEVLQQPQMTLEECEDAADAFDRAYEEMDAEIEREERESPISHSQSEQVDETHSSPTLHKNVSVIIEEATDEEATDKESSGEEDLSSSPIVVPLGTSDLDINVESLSEIHSDDEFSPHELEEGLPEAKADESAIHVEDQFATEPTETTGGAEAQLEQSPPNAALQEDVPGFPTSEPFIDNGPVIIGLGGTPVEPGNHSPIFPPADFVNTAVEVEHEQLQLPTPPAEQDVFLNHLPVKHSSSDVDLDNVMAEHGQILTAEDVVQVPAAPPAESNGSSNLVHGPSEAPTETEEASIKMDVAEQTTDAEVVNPKTAVDVTISTEVAVRDVTEDQEAVPDEWRGIIDEVASKAPSAEPESLVHDGQPSAGAFSKEASVISLPVTESNNGPSPPSYSVEEIPEEDVTDDDADGEVDPDTGGNPDQDRSSILNDLVGEIFNETVWAPDIFRKPSFGDDAAVHTASGGKPATREKVADRVPDEDDIASSREASPGMQHQSTRSSSPTIDPKELMGDSSELKAPILDLYGGSEAIGEGQIHESGTEDDTSEAALVREQGLTSKEEEASPTIPGLTLASSQRLTSTISGLGARPSDETVVETGDVEIPGLTWSFRKSPEPVHDWTLPSMMYPVTRRATEPVLFSDPYPYSLSTPGLNIVKDDGEDTEEDLEEHDVFLSSSSTPTSIDKDLPAKTDKNVKSVDEEEKQASDQLDDLHVSLEIAQEAEVTCTPVTNLGNADQEQDVVEPSGNEHQGVVEPTDDEAGATPVTIEETEVTAGAVISGDVDQDRDADGDLDPDFMQIHEDVNDVMADLAESVSSGIPEPVEALFVSDLDDSSAEPSELIQEPLAKLEEVQPSTEVQVTSATETRVQESQESDATAASGTVEVRSTEKRPKEPSEPPTVEEGDVFPAKAALAVADRTSSKPESVPSRENITVTPRRTTQNGRRKRSRSSESDRAETSRAPNRPSHRERDTKRPRTASTMNGKDKEGSLGHESSDEDSDHMPHESNVETTSFRSLATRASAAEAKSTEQFYPMLHKHGRGGKRQPSEEKVFSKRSLQKTQSVPSVGRPPAGSSSTYVPFTASRRTGTARTTRSNCRYRKISVPKIEDGPRVCFLVPGCSLGDQEVIAENEIEDLGDATHADSLRMIQDIESLDFDSYLIGVLRQLVGVDLLREQEVFYLPVPGEEPLHKSQFGKMGSDRHTSSKKSSKSSNMDYSSILSTPQHSMASAKSPPSKGSITTVASRERDSHTPFSALTSSDESEMTEDVGRKPGKMAHSKPERSKTSITAAAAAERSTKSGKQQLKRSRRLASDALEYKPISESEGEPSNDEKTPTPRRPVPQLARRGVKRPAPRIVMEYLEYGGQVKKFKRGQ